MQHRELERRKQKRKKRETEDRVWGSNSFLIGIPGEQR